MDVTIFQTRMRNLLAGLLVLVSMRPAYGGETMENETTDECAGSVQRSPEASRLLNYLQGIYGSKTLSGTCANVNWNINESKVTSRFSGPDNRLKYEGDYLYGTNNAYVLTNSREGWGYTFNYTVKAEPIRNLKAMFSYTHTEAKEISGMPGSAASSPAAVMKRPVLTRRKQDTFMISSALARRPRPRSIEHRGAPPDPYILVKAEMKMITEKHRPAAPRATVPSPGIRPI